MRGPFFSSYELDHCKQKSGVIRLALFMGVAPEREFGETDGAYWHRCKMAVLRADKLASKASRGGWEI